MAALTQSPRDMLPPCSSSSTTSTSSSNSCKSVQFSRFVKISFTYDGDEYDRSALEPSKLSPSEEKELLQMRSHWQKEMDGQHQVSLDDSGSFGCTRDPSTCSNTHCHRQEPSCNNSRPYPSTSMGRTRPHLLLQSSSSPSCSHCSPPCSPVLSHQDSCSSSSDDEYEPTVSPNHQLSSLTPQQQQQYQRLKRFGGSRNAVNGMMHRHSHLDQSKENVQCIA